MNNFYDDCIKFLLKKNTNFKVIKYGYFSKKKYFHLLEKSKLMIYFSSTESQGIAMQEAWSYDVPTLVYSQPHYFIKNKRFNASSSPYLTKYCGFFFRNKNEFKIKFDLILKKKLYPRKWLINNMSQDISVKKLMKIIKNI